MLYTVFFNRSNHVNKDLLFIPTSGTLHPISGETTFMETEITNKPVRRGMRLFFGTFIFILCFILLILAEITAGRVYRKFPANGRRAVASMIDEERVVQSGYYSQHPYLYYTHRSGYEALSNVQFNSLGHRNDEVPSAPEPGVLRILCIGGSTTVSFPYVSDPRETWPIKLEELIEKETGIKVDVINAGLNGGNSADLLAHYIFRNRYLKSHIVILHTGGNDATALLFPNYHPEYTHYTKGWRNTALVPRPLETAWLRFNLVKCVYAWWLQDIDLNAQIGRLGIEKLKPADCLKNTQKNEPEGFRRNLDLLVRTIIQDGAQPVLFPFVWAPEDVFRKMREYGPYYDPMVLAFKKNLSVIEEIAAKHNVINAKLSAEAIPGSHFFDFCHVNEKGEAIKAAHMLQYLKPIIQKLVDNEKLAQLKPKT